MITTIEPAQYVPTPYLWSSEEYQRLAETGVFFGRRIELIEGQVLQMSPMGSPHAITMILLTKLLLRIFDDRFSIQLQLPFLINDRSLPEPDAAIVRGGARDYQRETPVQAALLIEVSESTLKYDRTIKARLYASAGMIEYWIINLIENQIEIHRSPTPGDGYTEITIAKAGEKISPLVLPDVQIAVNDLLP
jgi:Uma2 family endonuclease